MLDNLSPTDQAIMAAGLGLLGTRGSAGFGRAGLMGLNQLEAAKKMKLLEEESRQREAERQSIAEMRAMQVQQMQAALAEAQRKQQQAGQIQQAARDSMMGPAGVALSAGGGPTVANAAKMDALPQGTRVMDEQGFADRVFEIDPMSGLALRQQMRERNAPVKLSKDDRLIDPTTKQELVGALPAQSEFERQAAEQYGKGTPAYQQAMRNWLLKQTTHAPGTSVNVSMDRGFGEVFAKNAAEALDKSREAAQASANSLQTLGRMNEALNSGKVIVGPTAKYRVFGLQLGETLGITGKDAEERLKNTRQLIQGSASLGLDGAKAMQGQGQVSNYERELVERASSGKIDDMTAPEFSTLIGVLDRVHRGRLRSHQQMMQNVPQQFTPYLPFYDVQAPAAVPGAGAQRGGAGGSWDTGTPNVIDWRDLPGSR